PTGEAARATLAPPLVVPPATARPAVIAATAAEAAKAASSLLQVFIGSPSDRRSAACKSRPFVCTHPARGARAARARFGVAARAAAGGTRLERFEAMALAFPVEVLGRGEPWPRAASAPPP